MTTAPDPLLLDVWREVCRHLDIQDSVPTLARILAEGAPVVGLQVSAYDPSRGALEVLASHGLDDPPDRRSGPRSLGAGEARRLLGWLTDGRPTLYGSGAPRDPSISILFGEESGGSWGAVPLTGPQGALGTLLVRYGTTHDGDPARLQLLDRLAEPFSTALENDRRLKELRALREESEQERRAVLARIGRDDSIETIIGHDGGLQGVMERVALVAPSNVPVLILGETGSGKEVIARAIHDRSPRSKGPFIRVNCGAIPAELVDSELFGHEKGAFTGATSSRRGWFERADGGTLLLDEIGELPLPAQVRLLRVLQEGTFERVGGEKVLRVDVRMVAATHRDLPAMVRQGKFREDLWYRITGFPVLLPPLRDRREDIPALAHHFAERAARRFGLRPLKLKPEDLELLSRYSWPGNIRELASVIDRAAILGTGESLEVAMSLGGNLVAEARTEAVRSEPARASESGAAPSPAGIGTLDDAMRRHIEAALAATRGRIEGPDGAARRLGLNPHTLRGRMRKLGIVWSRFRQTRR